jgi:hypothetical protein
MTLASATAAAFATSPASSLAELRAHIRWRGGNPPVVVHLAGARTTGTVRDISAGGAALAMSPGAMVGMSAKVEINGTVHLAGTVVRVFRGGCAVRWSIPENVASYIDQAIQFGLGPAEW